MPNPERRSKPKKVDTSGSSIPHWAEAINSVAKREISSAKRQSSPEKKSLNLAHKLAEQAHVKAEGLQFLVEHDLPRYKKISLHLQEFLDNPKPSFKQLVSQTGLYYSSIINLETGERIFRLGQRPKEVKKFIQEKLEKEEISPNSQLILSEYWHNYYGGNLLINKNGEILAELVKGKHAKLVKGEGQILMSAQTEPYTGVLKFSKRSAIDEELQIKLRRAIVKTLDLIPKKRVPLTEKVSARFQEPKINKKGQKCVKLPQDGYFEFILSTKNEEDKELRTIFIDARTGSAADKYQLTEQKWDGNVREVSFEPKIKKLRN
jgi:hypothetical protein